MAVSGLAYATLLLLLFISSLATLNSCLVNDQLFY